MAQDGQHKRRRCQSRSRFYWQSARDDEGLVRALAGRRRCGREQHLGRAFLRRLDIEAAAGLETLAAADRSAAVWQSGAPFGAEARSRPLIIAGPGNARHGAGGVARCRGCIGRWSIALAQRRTLELTRRSIGRPIVQTPEKPERGGQAAAPAEQVVQRPRRRRRLGWRGVALRLRHAPIAASQDSAQRTRPSARTPTHSRRSVPDSWSIIGSPRHRRSTDHPSLRGAAWRK